MNFKQWFLKEVNIDNENGWGQTPKNSSIDYYGIRVKMKPSVFLKLAASGGGGTAEAIAQHIKSGGSIGAPFLSVQFPQSWRDDIIEDYPEVTGHEGRNRMLAVLKTEGDIPIEVHLFGGRKSIEVRKSHIKSSWIQQMKKGMYAETQTREKGEFIPGPLFDEIYPLKEYRLNENTELEYWGPYSKVEFNGTYLVINANELSSPLYLPKDASFTYIDKWPINKTLNPPYNKYFRYKKDHDGKNLVTYTENRAVDVVCYNNEHRAVYLINRNSPPRGLALPGGFFDNEEDGFSANNPPRPERVGPIAAARELNEETSAKVDPRDLKLIGSFLTGSSDTREKTFRVWAYFYNVDNDAMSQFKYGDDASQAPGSDKLNKMGYKGWYEIDELPNLVFPHHKEIISRIIR